MHIRALKDFICRQEENQPSQHECSGLAGDWSERQMWLEARSLVKRASTEVRGGSAGLEKLLKPRLEGSLSLSWTLAAYTSVH